MSLFSLMKTSTAKTPKGYMKALTLQQPYATLVWLLLKENETRGWATRYRGPIAIHAGMRKMREGDVTLYMSQAVKLKRFRPEPYPYGAIIGVFRLVDCLPVWRYFKEIASTPFERHCGNYSEGRYVWRLEPITVFNNPVPYKGQQGLWHVPLAVLPEYTTKVMDG